MPPSTRSNWIVFRRNALLSFSPKLFLKMEEMCSSKKLLLTDKTTHKNAQIVQPHSDHIRFYLYLYKDLITLTTPGAMRPPRTGQDTKRSRKPADARECLTTLSLVAGILPCPAGRVVSSCPIAAERSIVQ
jgi:hypothetical protein